MKTNTYHVSARARLILSLGLIFEYLSIAVKTLSSHPTKAFESLLLEFEEDDVCRALVHELLTSEVAMVFEFEYSLIFEPVELIFQYESILSGE